jgi:CheY-like chemotaxis protein
VEVESIATRSVLGPKTHLGLWHLGTTKNTSTILLIEDDQDYAHILKLFLERTSEVKVTLALDPFEATDLLTKHCYDMVIADWSVPPRSAPSAIHQADLFLRMDPLLPQKWTESRVPVVLISADDHAKDLVYLPSMEHFQVSLLLRKQRGMRKIVDHVREMLGLKKTNGGGVH